VSIEGNDVNLARIASALERLVTIAERVRPAPAPTSGVIVGGTPFPNATVSQPPPPTSPAQSNRTEFQFSASAGARLREGDKHDPEHRGVKPSKKGTGLYCPTQLADGSYCNWKQA
jgi:hypothetical protein